ncbi:MAG: LacI family transcriptional regulator [Clostridia bacterium]|jgi:LacI family transcriptional regulator|nr:LacI family transcriptional regulator [Clostridia bacterium]
MDKKTVSIKDIAKKAGVSMSTVSRALNNTCSVSEELRDKVLAAAKSMDYVPNHAARSLVNSKTNTIGVIVNNMHDTFFSNLIKGFETGAQNIGYNVIFASVLGVNPTIKKKYIEYFSNGTVDGLVIYGARFDENTLLKYLGMNIKCVLIENDFHMNNCINLLVDNTGGMKMGIHYLYERGFRRIAYISGNPSRKAMSERLKGFFEGVGETNIDMEQCTVQYVLGENETTYDIVKKMLASDLAYDAFFCADDAIASYTIMALNDAGYAVPEDVSVLGFDNREVLPYAYRGKDITTIEQPLFTIGKDSIELLANFLNEGIASTYSKCYETRIVEKETVGRRECQ